MADEKTGAAEPTPKAQEQTALERVQAKRQARKDAARKLEEDRLAADLERISDLEEQLGDANVATVRIAYVDADTPVAASVRCPKPNEIKRYRDRVKPGQKDGRNRTVEPDVAKASEELCASCLVYPDAEAFARMCAARPLLAGQLGRAAVDLAAADAEEQGKD